MLITTIERESNDDDLFSKSAAILTAASEVAFHTMNTSSLNAEELRRDNGIPVRPGAVVEMITIMTELVIIMGQVLLGNSEEGNSRESVICG